jgi:hypothetical protein
VKLRTVFLLVDLLLLVSCSATSPTTAVQSSRSYNGSASVGDFLTFTIDAAAHTLTYADVSNGDGGIVPYTVNADGTYALSDPKGNLIAAYEVPGYALLVQAAKTGPNLDMPALVTAVDSGQISLATWEGHTYNYMQFRTSSGGLEVGSVVVNVGGTVDNSSYSPYDAASQNGLPFHAGTPVTVSQAQLDPSGTFFKVAEKNSTTRFDYIFGTANGIFAVDSSNGAILGLRQAATKDFDPSFAGTYKAIFYQKTGAAAGMGNTETGTASLGNATLVINSSGHVTISSAQGAIIAQAALTPVADTAYLYGSPGELQDPCFGVFTFRLTSANSQQDVFLTFMDRALLFASFRANLPFGSSGTYDYLYGVGLK